MSPQDRPRHQDDDRRFATIVGLVVVIVTVADVVLTMILPRRPSGIERLSLQVNRSVRVCFVLASRLAKTYERQDAILAPAGPVALVVQLLFWAACLVLGFALLLVGAGVSFADGLLQALTALFTVGAVHSGGPADTGVDISVGAIWVVIVALRSRTCRLSTARSTDAKTSLPCLRVGPASRRGVPNSWPGTSWSESPTPSRTCMPHGRSGRPTWPKPTPPTPCCPLPVSPSRGTRGSSGSSLCWMPPPCIWRSPRARLFARPVCAFGWDSRCSTGSRPRSDGRSTLIRIPRAPST